MAGTDGLTDIAGGFTDILMLRSWLMVLDVTPLSLQINFPRVLKPFILVCYITLACQVMALSEHPAASNSNDDSMVRDLASLERIKHSQPSEALFQTQQWLEQLTNDDPLQLRLTLQLAEIHYLLDNLDQANVMVQHLWEMAQRAHSITYQASALKLKSMLARSRAEYVSARQYLLEAKQLLAAQPDTGLQAELLYENAILDFFQGQIEQALNSVQLAKRSFMQSENLRMQGKAENIIGILLGTQGRYEESLQAMLSALDIAEKLSDGNTQTALLNNIAVTLQKLDDSQGAIRTYQQALALAQKMGDKQSEALALVNLGSSHLSLEQWQIAQDYSTQGLRLARELNARVTIARALNNLAQVARQQNQPRQVSALAEEALEIAEQTGDTSALAGPLNQLFWVHMQTRSYQAALAMADRLYHLAIQHSDEENQADALAMRTQAYTAMQQPQLALTALQEQMSIQQRLSEQQNNRQLAAMRSRFEATQKDLEITKLTQQQKLQAVELEKAKLELQSRQAQRNVMMLAMLAAFLLFFMLYRRWNQTRLTRHLVAEVAKRTEDLKRKNLELKSAYEIVEQRSLTDELTGLRNRRYLLKHLPQNSSASSGHWLFFLMDIDHFKQINDTFGHAAGDLVLVQMAELLGTVFRKTDYLIRWGGEEFLIMVQSQSLSSAADYAQRLRNLVASFNFNIGQAEPLKVTCSIGFTNLLTQNVQLWSQAIELADKCLYSAKHSSRNAWVGLLMHSPCAATLTKLLRNPELSNEQQGVMLASSVSNKLLWH